MRQVVKWLFAFAVMLACLNPADTRAEGNPDFYRGKTITLIIGAAAGGAYGLYGQLVADFLSAHIPGQPKIIVQYVPGAGGIRAMNNFFNTSPRDGTHIIIPHKDLVVAQLLRPDAVKFDARKMQWLGRLSEYPTVMVVTTRSGISSFEDTTKRPVILGGTGQGSQPVLLANLMNHFAGTKFRHVLGYRSAALTHLAMDQGEVQGRIGSLESIVASRAQWLNDSTEVKFIAQAGLIPSPELNLPLLIDFVRDQRGKEMVRLVDSGSVIGWSLATTPETPIDRVTVLKRSFHDMMRDSAFLAAAQQRKIGLSFATPEAILELVNSAASTDEKVVREIDAISKG